MNCGPRCLRYVHRKHGGRLSLTRAAKLTHTTRNGSLVAAMVEALQHLGFEARVEQDLTWEDLTELVKDNDVIVDWFSDFYSGQPTLPDGHYCVVEKVDETRIHMFDPDPDQVVMYPRSVFEAHWHDYEELDGKRIDFCRAAIVARKKEGHAHA